MAVPRQKSERQRTIRSVWGPNGLSREYNHNPVGMSLTALPAEVHRHQINPTLLGKHHFLVNPSKPLHLPRNIWKKLLHKVNCSLLFLNLAMRGWAHSNKWCCKNHNSLRKWQILQSKTCPCIKLIYNYWLMQRGHYFFVLAILIN